MIFKNNQTNASTQDIKKMAFSLGATLYVPAIRENLLSTITGKKYPELRSVVFCLEDSIANHEVEEAFTNLKQLSETLRNFELTAHLPLIFIRPRDFNMAERIINEVHIEPFTGLVLPKFTLDKLQNWLSLTRPNHLLWMPTLEDPSVFDPLAMRYLAVNLQHYAKDKVLAVRIGGNDLFSCLGLRRAQGMTIYEGPLASTISMIVATFASRGFSLTAPVFENLDDFDTLYRELENDISFGLIGKTAIHPSQILPIQSKLKVKAKEYQMAMQILNTNQAVFRLGNAMAEPATHSNWAENVILRASVMGVEGHLYANKNPA